jgi:hypothetical protein
MFRREIQLRERVFGQAGEAELHGFYPSKAKEGKA